MDKVDQRDTPEKIRQDAESMYRLRRQWAEQDAMMKEKVKNNE